jgi:hypothetical protein
MDAKHQGRPDEFEMPRTPRRVWFVVLPLLIVSALFLTPFVLYMVSETFPIPFISGARE